MDSGNLKDRAVEAGAVLYLDESGHSGRNYTDPGQPFYVLGGWLIISDLEGRCLEAVKTWERTVRLQTQQEVKAKAVLARKTGIGLAVIFRHHFRREK